MELMKNIFFNTDKLIENSNVKISYTGEFFQDGSEDVFIHYGFGHNWDNINEIQMEKTELGFQAELLLCEGDTFNFCFSLSRPLESCFFMASSESAVMAEISLMLYPFR